MRNHRYFKYDCLQIHAYLINYAVIFKIFLTRYKCTSIMQDTSIIWFEIFSNKITTFLFKEKRLPYMYVGSSS